MWCCPLVVMASKGILGQMHDVMTHVGGCTASPCLEPVALNRDSFSVSSTRCECDIS